MRIVAGVLRGRRLRVPTGKTTRPITERVREALFDMLGSSIQQRNVLDLYAGSGALGIEALSRGARRTVFVEAAPSAAQIIRANLVNLALTDPSVAQVVVRAVERSFSVLRAFSPFDLCFVDPPFSAVRDRSALRAVEAMVEEGILSPHAELIFESPSDQPVPSLQGFGLDDFRQYGDTHLAFFSLANGKNKLQRET